MTLNEFLLGALVYLAAAVISAPLAKRVGLGSVIGFLAAGAVLGPSVLGFVGSEQESVKHFAEFGVIVMLFLVGLELEPSRLWQLRHKIFGLGLAQVLSVAAVITLASLPFTKFWQESLVIGLILAMSSTAIVLQSMEEQGTLKSPVGQSVFSVLLFQDISVIPILALLPLLATTNFAGGADHGGTLISEFSPWLQAFIIIGVIAAMLLMGRYLARPLFRFVAATGAREIFVAMSLLIVVAITLLMTILGLSPALGTFLAGVVLADSEYKRELEMDLQPFKGLLLAIFFIAVGAGIDFSLLVTQPIVLSAGLSAFILLKLATHFGLAHIFKMPAPDKSRFGFALAQGSEFGFVLITFAAGLGLLTLGTSSLLTAIIALSMVAAPLLMKLDEKFVQPRFADGDFLRNQDIVTHDGVDAIIAGHGRFGMTVGRLLNAQGFRTVLLDIDPSQVDSLRKFGFKVFYGDALRLDLLESAGAREAKLMVIAIDDREKATELVKIAKQHFPNLKLFVRAYDRTHAHELIREGIDTFYREVFGSSMDMAKDALVALGHSAANAERVTNRFRTHDEKYLRAAAAHAGDEAKLVDLARQSRAEIAKVFAADKESETKATK
jgi:monovalent cation:proton antiporter-2 (CPA2) family protein